MAPFERLFFHGAGGGGRDGGEQTGRRPLPCRTYRTGSHPCLHVRNQNDSVTIFLTSFLKSYTLSPGNHIFVIYSIIFSKNLPPIVGSLLFTGVNVTAATKS